MPVRTVAALSLLCLAVVSGLSACGGSSHPSSTATTVRPAGSSPTTAASTTAPTTAAPTTVVLTGGGGGTFCAEARSASAKSIDSAGTSNSTPNLAQEYAEIKKIGPRLVAEAPASIRPAMSSLIRFDLAFYAILAKAGYNYTKIPPAQLATIESDSKALTADAATITTYFHDTCGVSLGTPSTT